MSAPSGLYTRCWADPSARPAILALLMLVALTVALLLAGGHETSADATPSCPVSSTNTVVTAPPTGTTLCGPGRVDGQE
jgi:hypothetical protein